MATEDSVVVQVTADVSGVEQGMNRGASAVKHAAHDMESSLDKVREHAVETAKELAKMTIGAVTLERIFELGKQSIESAEKVDRLTQAVGLSADAVQVLGYATGGVGKSGVDAMVQSFAHMERTAAAATAGNKAAQAGFTALGISGAQLAELIKKPDEMLKVATGNLAGMRDGANKTALAMAVLGKSAADQIETINKLGEHYDELEKRARAIGVVMSEDQIKALSDVDAKFKDLSQQAQGLANQVMIGLLPALNELSGDLTSLLQSEVVQEGFKNFATDTVQAIVVIKELGSETKKILSTLSDAWNSYWEDTEKGPGKLQEASAKAVDAMTYDVFKFVQDSMDEWTQIVGAAKKAWILIEEGGVLAYSGLKKAVAGFIEYQAAGLDTILTGIARMGGNWTAQIHVVSEMAKGTVESLRSSAEVGVGKYVHALNDLDKETQANIASNHKYVDGLRDQLREMTKLEEVKKGPKKDAPGIVDPATVDATNKATEAFNKLLEIQDKLTGQASGPYSKAYSELLDTFNAINDAADKAIQLGYDRVAVENAQTAATTAAEDAYMRKIDLIEKDLDVTGRALQKQKELAEEIGLDAQQLYVYKAVQDAVNDATQKGIELTDAQKASIASAANATYSATEAWKKYQDVAKETQQIWESGINSIADATGRLLTGQMDSFKDFRDSIVGTVKDMVSQMIAQYLRLQVIGPLMQSIFGASVGNYGGGSLVSAAVNAGIGVVAGGGSEGGTGTTSPSGQGGSGNGLFSYNNLSTGYRLFSGNGGIGGAYSSFMYGSGQTLPGASYFGSAVYGPGMGTYYAPTALGAGAAIGMGAYMGYNRWQQGGLGGGAVGGLAYGIGGTALGLGLGSMAAGSGFAAGVGAMGMGATTGAMAAIPIIGWIALAAMLVDMISGGKLFGTSANKFKDASTTMNIDGNGANIENSLTLSGQRAFFGGTYYRTKHPEETAEQKAAADAFYKAILDQSTTFAKQFGATVGLVATGSFTQHFDKKGNPIDGKTETVINGMTFKGETQEQFNERIVSESYILDLKQIGVDVTAFTKNFINDADKYAQAVEDAAKAVSMAQQDLKNGIDVGPGSGRGGMEPSTLQQIFDTTKGYDTDNEGMAATYARLSQELKDVHAGVGLLTGQKTVADIEKFLHASQTFGETLTQTYQRLSQAAQQYRSIMGQVNQTFQQLWAGNDPGRQFAVSMVNLNQQVQDQIDALNDAARAAGLQGASEEDLARVHSVAAAQAAAAMAQLQQAGLGLVDRLYGSGTIDGQIAALEARANSAANSVRNFGQSMSDAAQRAAAAIALLIGDKSPLNDKEKLNVAMQGLRQGQVSQDQVLEIARRLYGSSQAYNDIFRQVQQFPGGSGNLVGTGRSGGGLDAVDSAQLQALYAQRDAMQRQQAAQQLASITATMAAAQGKTFEEISQTLHYSLNDLADDLGMSMDELNDYLTGLENANSEVPDSITTNTDRLIDALYALLGGGNAPGRIVDAVNDHGHSMRESIDRGVDATRTVVTTLQNPPNPGGHRGGRGG